METGNFSFQIHRFPLFLSGTSHKQKLKAKHAFLKLLTLHLSIPFESSRRFLHDPILFFIVLVVSEKFFSISLLNLLNDSYWKSKLYFVVFLHYLFNITGVFDTFHSNHKANCLSWFILSAPTGCTDQIEQILKSRSLMGYQLLSRFRFIGLDLTVVRLG